MYRLTFSIYLQDKIEENKIVWYIQVHLPIHHLTCLFIKCYMQEDKFIFQYTFQ